MRDTSSQSLYSYLSLKLIENLSVVHFSTIMQTFYPAMSQVFKEFILRLITNSGVQNSVLLCFGGQVLLAKENSVLCLAYTYVLWFLGTEQKYIVLLK